MATKIQKITSRQLATMLAALRYWQSNVVEDREEFSWLNGSGHFEDETPLRTHEIDRLCERLNGGWR